MANAANGGDRNTHADGATSAGLASLAVFSIIAGAASGLLATAFRLVLERADQFRTASIDRMHAWGPVGASLLIVSCAAATVVSAWLVRRFSPDASGSGIPQVEATLEERMPRPSILLLPVKFIGGVLAIGTGLALGREGPSVQMGAGMSHLLGRVFRRDAADCRVLLAAGAGAGLATAFNAPIAGAVFVLEELVRRFDTRITIATFGASAGAIAVARPILGDRPDFIVEPIPYAGFAALPAYLAMGALLGVLGVAYNRAIRGGLAATDRLARCPTELRAAVVGAAVGIVAWFLPALVGGGDPITQRTLTDPPAASALALFFVLRFALGAMSYAARTPGGLFAPMLVLGAQSGVLFGTVCGRWLPGAAPSVVPFGVVGMAALFTAVVRAPLTGIALVIEMTGNFTLLLPMLAACFGAMVVPTLLGDSPIYDVLRERALADESAKTATRG
jgi:CIC family chloride channel protein